MPRGSALLVAATALIGLVGCGGSSGDSSSSEATAGQAAGTDVIAPVATRKLIMAGVNSDFAIAKPGPAAFTKCFLPRFESALSAAEIARLASIYDTKGQPRASQALNTLAAPIAGQCGGRRYMPELIAASKALE